MYPLREGHKDCVNAGHSLIIPSERIDKIKIQIRKDKIKVRTSKFGNTAHICWRFIIDNGRLIIEKP